MSTAANQIQEIGSRRLLAALNAIFAQQARDVASKLRLDGEAPDLTPWIAATAQVAKPILLQMTQVGILQAQRRIDAKIGKRPVDDLRTYNVGNETAFTKSLRRAVRKAATLQASFNIANPKVLDAVDVAAFAFCRETMETATTDLNAALAKLRLALREGLSTGEATRWLSAKVLEIFASPMRAFRIAVTESSRAVHAGQMMAAVASGVVKSKTWLASSDACELCLELDGKNVPLDQPFYVDPKGGPYATVLYPPLHPHCFCDWTEEIE